MFTLEIGGRAVAIASADKKAAEAFFTSDLFKMDMKRWQAGGAPVWDGSTNFRVREATPEEVGKFRKAAHGRRRPKDESEPVVAFLIDAHDPDDIEED